MNALAANVDVVVNPAGPLAPLGASVKLIESLTIAPARILVAQYGNLEKNKPADITIIDLNEQWKVNPEEFLSKGKNSPLDGYTLTSKVFKTIYQGKIVF